MHTQDLTQGNLSRHLLRLALPLIFGNLLQQFYNTIDAFVIGRYAGQQEFAAIGIAGTVMNLFLFAVFGACTGLSVLFARCYGLADQRALRRQHFTALYAGLLLTLLLSAVGLFGMNGILALIQTPTELSGFVRHYLSWIFLGLPAAFLYNMYASALRASGDTAAALYILAASVAANLGLDLLFVARFGMGIAGAAQATVFTQIFSAVLCIVYLFHSHQELLLSREDLKFNGSLLRTTLKCSIVTALHQTSVYIGKMLVQGIVNTAGTEVIAAYTAATRIEGFVNSLADSGSASTSVLIAQNYGAGKKDRVRKASFCSLRILFLLGLLCAVALFFAAPPAVKLMLGHAEGTAYASAVRYLRVISFFYFLCYTGSSFTGYYNGLARVGFTLFGSVLQISLRVIFTWILFRRFELAAVAAATGIGWFCANLFWAFSRIHKSKKSLF